MKLIKKAGDTSVILQVFIQDSSATTGIGLSGLVYNSSGLTAYYHRQNDTTATAITLATMTVGTFTSSGFKEIDATNMKGWYQFCPPDAALAAGATSVAFHLKGVTNMAPLPIEIQLVAVDLQDTVRFGMTALPNAAAAAANGLPILGTNAQAISFTAGVTISNASGSALTLTSSGSNGSGLIVAGNGSGPGIKSTGGATGDGMLVTGGSSSGNGLAANGAVSGFGIRASGVGGGIYGVCNTSNGSGIQGVGFGIGSGLQLTAGATGSGFNIIGGSTSGHGIAITTTSGDGINSAPTAGHGMILTANGTSKHGLSVTGGTAGTSNGLTATAGTGGVDISGNITGNLTGNVSGSVGSVTGITISGIATGVWQDTTAGDFTAANSIGKSVMNGVSLGTGLTIATVSGAVGSVTGAVGSVTGNVGGNVTGTVGGLTAAGLATFFSTDSATTYASAVSGSVVKEIADNAASALTAAAISDAVWEEAIADHSGTGGSTAEQLAAAGAGGDPWNTALPGAYASGKAGYILGTNLDALISSRMATYTQPTGFLAATFPGTVASTTNITGGTITTTTNLTNLPAITSNWLTATGIAASALNGKGDWNVGKTGYTVSTVSDKTGYSITGTITSLDALATHGDSSWSTATGFATPTNITAGTITTVTTLTNPPSSNSDITAIKTATDKLTFTVPNQVDVNIQYVNDVQVTGDGSSGTPWGP